MSKWRWIGAAFGLIGIISYLVGNTGQYRFVFSATIFILCAWPLLPLVRDCLLLAGIYVLKFPLSLIQAIETIATTRAQRKRTEAVTREVKQHHQNMQEGMSRQSLHRNINELLSFAHDFKPDGAENDLLRSAMMDVLGRLAELSVDPSLYQTPRIAADVKLFLEHLEEMGLQDDLLYKRARNIFQPASDALALPSPARFAVR